MDIKSIKDLTKEEIKPILKSYDFAKVINSDSDYSVFVSPASPGETLIFINKNDSEAILISCIPDTAQKIIEDMKTVGINQMIEIIRTNL